MAGSNGREGRRRRITSAVVVILLLVGGGWLYLSARAPVKLSAEGLRLFAQASAAATAAGCTGVRTVAPYPGGLDRAHIGNTVASAPPLSSYPSTPPASGPHDPTPLDAGVYGAAPPAFRAIHSLEHGAVIVWLAHSASGADADALRAFFEPAANHEHVIVAPYDYPSEGSAGELPAGRQMVLIAWHRIQLCRSPSAAVAVAFMRWYTTPTRVVPFGPPRGYRGEAPEAGAGI